MPLTASRICAPSRGVGRCLRDAMDRNRAGRLRVEDAAQSPPSGHLAGVTATVIGLPPRMILSETSLPSAASIRRIKSTGDLTSPSPTASTTSFCLMPALPAGPSGLTRPTSTPRPLNPTALAALGHGGQLHVEPIARVEARDRLYGPGRSRRKRPVPRRSHGRRRAAADHRRDADHRAAPAAEWRCAMTRQSRQFVAAARGGREAVHVGDLREDGW